MTTNRPHGAVPPAPPVQAPAHIMATARTNCAARLHAQGHEAEALRFERGDRDQSFAMRHEVAKLVAEAGHDHRPMERLMVGRG